VTSSVAEFKAAIRVKSMHMIKLNFKTSKKRENMEIKESFYINLYRKDWLGMNSQLSKVSYIGYIGYIATLPVRHSW